MASGPAPEIYNPTSGIWTATGLMNNGRSWHAATLLRDGKVLISGGVGGGTLSSAELYDPTTETWSLTGSMKDARLVHSSILLPNGKVLVVGGDDNNSNLLRNAEIFYPNRMQLIFTTQLVNATAGVTMPQVQVRAVWIGRISCLLLPEPLRMMSQKLLIT